MAIVQSLYYIIYGVFLTLYLYLLFKPRKDSTPSTIKNKDEYYKKLYLNIFFMDRKEIIRNIIRSKVPKNRPFIRALAKRAAVALLEKGIISKIAENLCGVIPERLEILGLKVNVNIGYVQSAYVCIEITITNIDLFKFLSLSTNNTLAEKIINFLDRFMLPMIVDGIKKLLISIIASKVVTNLPATVKEKLYNKSGIECEMIVCSEEEQGPFLIQTIQQLNASSEELPPQTAASTTQPSFTPSQLNPSSSSNEDN